VEEVVVDDADLLRRQDADERRRHVLVDHAVDALGGEAERLAGEDRERRDRDAMRYSRSISRSTMSSPMCFATSLKRAIVFSSSWWCSIPSV
jgi:hypothetical protein